MIRTALWVGLLTMMIASVASAAPITLPSGLNPGDTYFLVFVTAGTRDATSSNIADYDAFVTAQANLEADLLALGTTWKAIGSTSSDDAVTHIAVTGPVYNLADQQVATGSPDMFDGSLGAPIGYNQYGDSFFVSSVWTGSAISGIADPIASLGSPINVYGNALVTNGLWIDAGTQIPNAEFAVYGMSGPLVVPTAAVPEPTTISLMLAPALLLLGRYRTRRRRPATRTTPSGPAVH